MNWLKIVGKIGIPEYLKLASAVYLIGTSVYDLLEDLTKLRKEHGVLLIGLVVLFKTIHEVVEKVKALISELKTDVAKAEKPKV